MFTAGSGSSAARSLTGTMEKALCGSGKLHSIYQKTRQPPVVPVDNTVMIGSEGVDVSMALGRATPKVNLNRSHDASDCDTESPPRRADGASSPSSDPVEDAFLNLATDYPLQCSSLTSKGSSSGASNTHNVDDIMSAPIDSMDPWLLLQWSWRVCIESEHLLVQHLKKHAGCCETDALYIVKRMEIVVEGFSNRVHTWNIVNGVGPLGEAAIVDSIREVLLDKGMWMEKLSAVWHCALVHMSK